MRGRWTYLGVGLIVLSMLLGLRPEGWTDERYTVKAGDTLHGISKSFGVAVEALKKANGLEGDGIKARQVLIIPVQGERRAEGSPKKYSGDKETYVVKPGDSLCSVSKRVGLSVDEVRKMNHLSSMNLKVGQKLIFPRERPGEEDLEEGAEAKEGVGEPAADGNGQKKETREALGKWNSEEERNLFVKVAKTFLGVPYRLGGATLRGIDCSAFVKRIYEIFDIHLPRTSWEQFQSGRWVDRTDLEEGDLVFFRTPRASGMHVGIYIGNSQFVHASNREKEVKVDTLETPYFSARFLKGVRVKELERES